MKEMCGAQAVTVGVEISRLVDEMMISKHFGVVQVQRSSHLSFWILPGVSSFINLLQTFGQHSHRLGGTPHHTDSAVTKRHFHMP